MRELRLDIASLYSRNMSKPTQPEPPIRSACDEFTDSRSCRSRSSRVCARWYRNTESNRRCVSISYGRSWKSDPDSSSPYASRGASDWLEARSGFSSEMASKFTSLMLL